jgi:rhamnosyltransferase
MLKRVFLCRMTCKTNDRNSGHALPYVVAIVVTYHPDLDLLAELLSHLTLQVTEVVLIDNGSPCNLIAWNAQQHTAAAAVLALGQNRGIAVAHNAGIEWARNRQAQYVLLMDQDSIPEPDMVQQLFFAIGKQLLPAAVGSRYLDERQNNPPPFIRIRGLTLHRCACTTENSVVPVDYLISSGCLIPMSILNQVGYMRDDLFIDYVDIEWGLRARRHGFQSYGVCSARMRHTLGEHPIKFLGKYLPLHSPLRHYYHFRNAVLLYKEPWVPLNWKLVDGWRLCLKYAFYSIFAKPRITHFRMMTLGMWHGLAGKTGKLIKDGS